MKVITLIAAFFAVACSKGGMPVENQRDQSFFAPVLNSSDDFEAAANKMSDLKLLTSNEKYDMRFALFDNGKFYYEVANLGQGTGDWKFRDGYINLFAMRTFFNLDIDLTAAAAQGDSLEMRFADRFGKNAVQVRKREPSEKPLQRLRLPSHQKL